MSRSAPAVGLALLLAACGSAPASHVGSQTTQLDAALAFSRCMRSHGVPNFPDPDPQGNFPPFQAGVSKQTANAAGAVCKHLLSRGGTATPQQRHEKLAFGVRVAECLRAHGYPSFPDPSRLGSQSFPPGIDPNSSRFQTRETACEQRARQALGLP
jgi:hypothetical protein